MDRQTWNIFFKSITVFFIIMFLATIWQQPANANDVPDPSGISRERWFLDDR